MVEHARGHDSLSEPRGSRRRRPFARLVLGAALACGAALSLPIPAANATDWIGSTASITSLLTAYAATLTRVADPATLSSGACPASGTRLVAAIFSLHNASEINADVAIGQEASGVLDESGHTYAPRTTSSTRQCSVFGSLFTLAAGTSASGCVLFAVPTADHLVSLSVESGGKALATWNLTSGPPAHYSASVTKIKVLTATRVDYTIFVTNTGGTSGTPVCKTTLNGPNSAYYYNATEKLGAIPPGQSRLQTYTGLALAHPEARLLTAASSKVTCS